MKVSKKAKLIKKVQTMELNNPVIQTLLGLVIFYIGLKMFSGGMKSMGNIDHLQWFLGNPIYMFVGGIVMTLLWQSSSLSTTALAGQRPNTRTAQYADLIFQVGTAGLASFIAM